MDFYSFSMISAGFLLPRSPRNLQRYKYKQIKHSRRDLQTIMQNPVTGRKTVVRLICMRFRRIKDYWRDAGM